MRSFMIRLLVLLAVPVTVLACEGDCIVGITNAFVGNYSSPLGQLMKKVVRNKVDMGHHCLQNTVGRSIHYDYHDWGRGHRTPLSGTYHECILSKSLRRHGACHLSQLLSWKMSS